MTKRFKNTKLMWLALAFLLVKVVLLPVTNFLYNRFLPATFPSVLYGYIFTLSLFTRKMSVAASLLPVLFFGSCLPSLIAGGWMLRNKKGAGVAAFALVVLTLADIIFVCAYGWMKDWIFGLGTLALNGALILFLMLMHSTKYDSL